MVHKETQIKNVFIYLVPSILVCLLPLITLPIFTRILTPEDYGVFALAQVYALFVSGLANFGMGASYERNFFKYRDAKKSGELLYSTLVFVLSALIILGGITFLFGSFFSRWVIGSDEYSLVLFLSYCSAGVLSFFNYYLIFLKNSENARIHTLYSIVYSVVGALLSIIMVVFLKMGILGLICGPLISGLICIFSIYFFVLKDLPFGFNWKMLKESIKLSYPLTPMLIFKVVGVNFDKYMIGLMSTAGNVGFYSIGQKIASMGHIIMAAMENVFAPQVYKKMFDLGDEGGAAVGRYLTPCAYVSLFICFLVALFCEEVITLLTPTTYHGAINIAIILSMVYGHMFFGKQPQLLFKKKTAIISIISIFEIVINVLINIPFILKWGAIGAAWATLIASLILRTIKILISQYYYNIKWEYKKIFTIVFLFFGSAILTLVLRYYMVGYLYRLPIKLFLVGLYLYLGNRLNIVSRENVVVLKNIFLNFKKTKLA